MSACKYAGRGEPRILVGRHGEECPETSGGSDLTAEECSGCLPCTLRHCPCCERVHADGACPECIAATRDDLLQIAVLCGELPEEAQQRGAHSEAAMLWGWGGLSADPEAMRNRAMSAIMGRIPAWYLEDNPDDNNPDNVLNGWERIYRDHFEHYTGLKATMSRVVDYLERHLHEFAETEDVPFEDFARDLRSCRAHLQAVMHDQAQGDRANVGCFDCGGDLERRLTEAGFEDHWTCRRCRRRYTDPEYHFALRAQLEAQTSKEAS